VLLKPNPENICFGCGGANARGMLLAFEQDDATQRIRGNFRYFSFPWLLVKGFLVNLRS